MPPTIDKIFGLKLIAGEAAFFNSPATLVEQRTVTEGYQGGSRGVSIRLFKGVSYRIGAHRGQLIKSRRYVPVASGVLVLTNRRAIFSSDSKSFSIQADKIGICEIAPDCIIIGQVDKPRVLRCAVPADAHSAVAALVGFAPAIIPGAVFTQASGRGCFSRLLRAAILILIILVVINAIANGCSKTTPASNAPAIKPALKPPSPVTAPLRPAVVAAPTPAPANAPLRLAVVAETPPHRKAAQVGQVVTLTLRSGRIMKGEVTAIGGTEVAIKSLTQAATVTIARGSLTPESASSVFGD